MTQLFLHPEDVPADRIPLLDDRFIVAAFAEAFEELRRPPPLLDEIPVCLESGGRVRQRRTSEIGQEPLERRPRLRDLSLKCGPAADAFLAADLLHPAVLGRLREPVDREGDGGATQKDRRPSHHGGCTNKRGSESGQITFPRPKPLLQTPPLRNVIVAGESRRGSCLQIAVQPVLLPRVLLDLPDLALPQALVLLQCRTALLQLEDVAVAVEEALLRRKFLTETREFDIEARELDACAVRPGGVPAEELDLAAQGRSFAFERNELPGLLR